METQFNLNRKPSIRGRKPSVRGSGRQNDFLDEQQWDKKTGAARLLRLRGGPFVTWPEIVDIFEAAFRTPYAPPERYPIPYA